jgi:uncharacterized protein involved in response to NO
MKEHAIQRVSFTGSFWSLGFRPLFLLGSIYGIIALSVWVATLGGWSFNQGIDSYWHAHEMMHGFVVAIIIGFLMTATQNWTGIRGIHGTHLGALALVWLTGRLVMLLTPSLVWLTAMVDLLFLPLCIISMAPYFKGKKQRRNLVLVGALGLLWLSNIAYHLEAIGLVENAKRIGLYLGTNLSVLLIVIIGSRVLPFFSEKALDGYKRPSSPLIDRLLIPSTGLFLLLSPFFGRPLAHNLSSHDRRPRSLLQNLDAL